MRCERVSGVVLVFRIKLRCQYLTGTAVGRSCACYNVVQKASGASTRDVS